MPKSRNGGALKRRRSSRLQDRQIAATRAQVAAHEKSISAPGRSRRRQSVAILSSLNARGDDVESTSTTKPLVASGSDSRRSQRTNHQALQRRERSLSRKEKALTARSADLQQRMHSLEEKEVEMMSQMADREKETILKQLEEHFLCSLCYDILAAPYLLNPSQCGHTFCGLCILKWFFSRLHRHCGTWHESVDCPMCRSLLIITPDHIPRLQLTFPFVPNRVAASVVESLVEQLAEQPTRSQARTTIKREESEGACSGSHSQKSLQRSLRKREVSDDDEDSEEIPNNSSISTWREGGRMRAEWLERDREGKQEMRNLLLRWTTMGAPDFIALKEKLGV